MTTRTPVEQAAYEWWRAYRPLQWLESDHLQTPCVNCTSEREYTLAKAIAAMVGNETEQVSDDAKQDDEITKALRRLRGW